MNGPDSYPGQVERHAERTELWRIASQSALDRSRGGEGLDPGCSSLGLEVGACEAAGEATFDWRAVRARVLPS